MRNPSRTSQLDRRSFLTASALGAGSLAFLDGLPVVSAADAKPDPNLVSLDSGIEPLVRLLEETPREKLLEEVGSRVKKGLAYREVLAALLLAGVRNIQPRPNVGFKFHAVLVVNSAHQAALAGPDKERWLPLFWALDNFKSAQAQNIKESGWRMKPVDEMNVPKRQRAREAFTHAMDNWDVEAADVAVAGLARYAEPGEMFDIFARYGARDFRDIGHKAIYVANAFRTLEVIGWNHAEPVLRSLAFAILKYDGKNPSKEDLDADRPGRKNLERIRMGRAPKVAMDHPVTGELVRALQRVRGRLSGQAQAAWAALNAADLDALFLGGVEPHAPARHRRLHSDDAQRAPLRVPHNRRQRHPKVDAPSGRGIHADVPRGDEEPREDRRREDRRTHKGRGKDGLFRGECVRGSFEGQDRRGQEGDDVLTGQPGRAERTDRRGPAVALPQGQRLARLQVQFGGPGRYGVHFTRMARPLPGREPFLDERFARTRRAGRQANARGAGVIYRPAGRIELRNAWLSAALTFGPAAFAITNIILPLARTKP